MVPTWPLAHPKLWTRKARSAPLWGYFMPMNNACGVPLHGWLPLGVGWFPVATLRYRQVSPGYMSIRSRFSSSKHPANPLQTNEHTMNRFNIHTYNYIHLLILYTFTYIHLLPAGNVQNHVRHKKNKNSESIQEGRAHRFWFFCAYHVRSSHRKLRFTRVSEPWMQKTLAFTVFYDHVWPKRTSPQGAPLFIKCYMYH